jgi:chemotaxis protein CheC
MTLSAIHLDILKELINIGVGNGANLLNKMIKQPIKLSTIEVKIVDATDIINEQLIEGEASSVEMNFSGELNGRTNLLFPSESALKLIDLVAPGIKVEDGFSQVKKNVLMEIGNIVINGVVGSLSNILKIHSRYSLPVFHQGLVQNLFEEENNGKFILAKTRFDILDHRISGSLLIFLEVEAYKTLEKLLDKTFNHKA